MKTTERSTYPGRRDIGPLRQIRGYLRKQRMARRMALVARLRSQIARADAERSSGVAASVGRCRLIEH